MYVRKKKYPSGNIGIIVVEKTNGKMNELVTIGIASSDDEIDGFVNQGKEWIEREKERRHPRLDLFGDERRSVSRSVWMLSGFCPISQTSPSMEPT